MNTLEKILSLLQEKGVDQQEFTTAIGIGKYAVTEWKSGKTKSYKKHIDKIATFLDVSTDYLLGNTDDPRPINLDIIKYDDFQRIPVIGIASAGNGCLAETDIIGYEMTPSEWLNPYYDYTYIVAKGDSMSPKIEDGDRLLVQTQSAVDNGDYAIVLIDDEQGLVKKFYHEGNKIILKSLNPDYPDREFYKYEMNRVRVYGKVIMVMNFL